MLANVLVRFAVFATCIALASRADAATDSLSGAWTATALSSSWKIGDWGAACGPKPSGGGEPSGTATISESGGELVISGVGRTYTTRECWEQFPGLTRTGHTVLPGVWRTTCKSPAGDPRQASIVTTLTASPDQIVFDETGQYQFVIQGQNCTASVRRSRFFRRARAPVDGGTPLAEPRAGDGKPAPAATSKAAACKSPGPPARIEVSPSRKLIRPGESFTFKAGVVDARGCALSIAPAFRGVALPATVTVATNGRVEVGEGTPEGELQLVAAVGARNVAVTLQVVSRERYDALLAQGGFDPSGASTETAVGRLESGSVGARSTVLEDTSARRRTIFVAVVGSAALLLGVLGLVLVRRGRKKAAERANQPASGGAPSRAPARGASPVVCPTCRNEYPPGAEFCAVDGNRLVPLARGTGVGPAGAVCPICGQGYDPGVAVCPKHDEPLVPPAVYGPARTLMVPEIRKICPVCGSQFTGDSRFCGKCGAALVQVN